MRLYGTLIAGVLFLSFFFTACGEQDQTKETVPQTDCEKAGYKGRVKEVSLQRYFASDEEGEEWYSTLGPTLTLFNEDGSLKEKKSYSNLDVIMYGYSYEYEGGKLVRAISLSESLAPESIFYTYDEAGNLIEKKIVTLEVEEGNEKVTDHIVYTYDKKNRLIEERILEYGGYEYSYPKSKMYRYDEADRKIEEIIHNVLEDGESFADTITWKYDKKGRLLEELYLVGISDEYPNSLQTYLYDEHGNKKEIKYSQEGKELYSIFYSYVYENGRIKEETEETPDGEKNVTTYDEHGNILLQLSYNQGGEITSKIEYVYDAKGNVIKNIFSTPDDNGILREMTVDEITISYYD
ncbi:MAG: hypothetical protein Q3998_03180 [Porphyromonas sp.]|nr:hypothetical protein [Porphyromonas sp.]